MPTEFIEHPHIEVESVDGNVITGKYISHTKANRNLSIVVIEKANGSRSRDYVVSDELDDALAAGRVRGL